MRKDDKWNKFIDTFYTGTHGASGECSCGVFHYDTANTWDDDHHEYLEKLEKENDWSMRQLHDSAICFIDIAGSLYVVGCRCGMDKLLFEFLHDQKDQVLTFYVKTKDKIDIGDI